MKTTATRNVQGWVNFFQTKKMIPLKTLRPVCERKHFDRWYLTIKKPNQNKHLNYLI
jgi:hypothetical protein